MKKGKGKKKSSKLDTITKILDVVVKLIGIAAALKALLD